MGPTTSSDKNDLTTTTLPGEPIAPQASDTSTVTPMPTGADMPSMTPSAPTMTADPIAANEPGPIQMNPSAPAAPASMAPSSTVLAPTPVKKKNNIVIIGTAILLIAMLIVLVVVYQRTKS